MAFLRAIVITLLAGLLSASARADAPAARMRVLSRGLNVSHWFRFPPVDTAEAMCCDLDDQAIASLKHAGFTFIRLPVGPEEVMQSDHIVPAMRDAIVAAIARFEKAGLAVLIDPNPELLQNWNLQDNAQARGKLVGFWRDLAPALRRLPASLTFPELVNEPLFKDPALWDAFQRRLLSVIRAALPHNTIILTGTDWSSIDGLLHVRPVADPDVIYSFHSYEPQLLTLLAEWDPAVKQMQLAQLPFPVRDPAPCRSVVASIADAHTRMLANAWCSEPHDRNTITSNLARAAAWGHAHRVSVVMTEFGAAGRLNPRARQNYLAATRQAAEQLHLHWGLWALDDQMGFDQQPGGYRSAGQLCVPVLRALGLSPVPGTRP